MAHYSPAVELVLKNEGSTYTEGDGHASKYGLTMEFLHGEGLQYDKAGIRDMTHDQATVIYKSFLWDRYGFGRLSNQLVANYLFDMGVNLGMVQAVKLAQRGVWAATQSLRCQVDGILGEITVGNINNASQCYLPILRALRIAFYVDLVQHNPSKLRFLQGWLNRAMEVCI